MKIMIMLGLMFLWNIQPYMMIISLMVITLGYSMYIYMSMGSYWYSYMLMLVMLSGVLVLFSYIASLIPNESFEYMKLLYVSIFIYMVFVMKFNYMVIYWGDMSVVLLKMWMMCVSLYNLYLVMFLMSIMVMVVWLSDINSGAIRNY